MATSTSTAASTRAALVFGGCGALGRAVIAAFTAANWKITSVDFRPNDQAAHNVVLSPGLDLEATGRLVESEVTAALGPAEKFDAVLNVAGGWAGGNFHADDLYKNTTLMLSQSLNTSVIAARLAALHLSGSGGLLAVVGAAAAAGPTPSMVAYGAAKAAVHHIIRTAADVPASGLPTSATVVGLLPVTLDTPANRSFNPGVDYSSWTPLDAITQKLLAWAEKKES
ncbi:hypothetical protein HK405_001307, partial [Cladochytrium tenue]